MSIWSSVLLTSQKRNRYVFDKNQKKLTLCHPILSRLIEMDQCGEDPGEWVRHLEGGSEKIEGIGSVSPEEMRYYYSKYLLLKENGYFKDKNLDTRTGASLRKEDIDALLANDDNIVFEVTDKCNLKCEYCSFGRFYDNYGPRKNRNMDPKIARIALDFFLAKMKSSRNDSRGHRLHVGFYGGEPLLNFLLIREIVEYFKLPDLSGIDANFNVTTNGLLLEKHIDFLVEHRFHLLISLDGNEKNNSYRVFENGQSAFSEVVRNVDALQARFPDYFRERVNFNVVLHDRNSIPEVSDFFKKRFDRVPSFSSISIMGIREEAREEYRKIYKIVSEGMKNCSDSPVLERRTLFRLPQMRDLLNFLHHQNSFTFVNFNHLLIEDDTIKGLPSGTCMPFQKKVFITVDGRIFPCERVGQNHEFGRVESDEVHLNHETLMGMYNDWYAALKPQCISCYIAENCPICMYYIKDFPQLKSCQWHTKEDDFRDLVSKYVDILEKRPQIYQKILDEG